MTPNEEQRTKNEEPFAGIYAGKRILLTGHTGFKGAWLARWLLDLGAEVAGFARDPLPHETLFDAMELSPRLARDVRGDLADLDALTALVADFRPDFVFHLAAQPLVRLSYEIPVETFTTNVLGTVNVLEALRRATAASPANKEPRTTNEEPRHHPVVAVMITTDKCYENREWLHSYREEDAMGGYDPYSASKGAAEIAIHAYRRSYFSRPDSPVRVASARAGNVIGGGDWAVDRIVPDCFRSLRAGEPIPVRNKIATRPWQHVLEPLSGYLALAAAMARTNEEQGTKNDERAPLLSGAFNFGPALTSNRTVAQLVEELIRHAPGEWVDRSDPHAVHEASKLNLAIDKAFHVLGWRPVWNFEETIAHVAGWYVRNAAGENAAALCDEQIAAYTAAARTKQIPWAG